MSWEALGAVGELVGAAGAIVSLLYLASQVRNNSRQLRHASAQAVLAPTAEPTGHMIISRLPIWASVWRASSIPARGIAQANDGISPPGSRR
jgi:hypothetical protein